MRADGVTSASLRLPTELTAVAETLGFLLSARLTESIQAAFSVEAKIWRADLQRILEECRDASPCDASNSAEHRVNQAGSKQCGHKGTLATQSPAQLLVDDVVQPATPRSTRLSHDDDFSEPLSGKSSGSSRSCRLVFASRRKLRMNSAEVEKRLAAKVISAKLLNPVRHAEVDGAQRGRRSTSSFDPLVPPEPIPTQEGQCQMFIQGVREDCQPSSSSICSESIVTARARISLGDRSALHPLGVSASPSNENNRVESFENELVPSMSAQSDVSIAYMSSNLTLASRARRCSSAETPKTVKWWRAEAHKFFDHKRSLVGEPWGPARRIVLIVPRVLGIIAWNMDFVCLSRIYQLALFGVLTLSTVSVAMRLSWYHGLDSYTVDFSDHVNDVLAIGALFSYLACLLQNQAFLDSQFLVESYLSRAGFLEELNRKSCVEMAALLVVWLLCGVSRFYANAPELDLHDFVQSYFSSGDLCLHLAPLPRP